MARCITNTKQLMNNLIAINRNKIYKYAALNLICLLCFNSFILPIKAQNNEVALVLHPSNPNPCKNDRIQKPFPIKTPYVREADIMWSKRIWRVIDLREKINLPLYYPAEPTMCVMSLFDVFKKALLSGELTAYANPIFDDEFTAIITKDEIQKMLVTWDSTHQVENINNPGQYINSPLKTEISAASIRQYWIKEDWFFDKQRSVMEPRIIGICPLVEKLSESGEVIGVKPLFWIHFPDARVYLAKAASYNSHNDAQRMSYDEVFLKRKFSSYVYKESNVYNRAIAEYKKGTGALLESEEIKEDIFNYEHDLWQY
jgi:gliding motility associated protien GldN